MVCGALVGWKDAWKEYQRMRRLSAASYAAFTCSAWYCQVFSHWPGIAPAEAACTHLPAEQRRWWGAGGGCVLGPFYLPVPLLSHATQGSPGRGKVSLFPSSKKRSCFPWCWWVLPAGLQPLAVIWAPEPQVQQDAASPAFCPSLLPEFEESVSLQFIVWWLSWRLGDSLHCFLFLWLVFYG